MRQKNFVKSGPRLTVVCQKCGQKAAVRAARCPQHGEVVKLIVSEGEPAACSKCGFRGP